MSPFSPLSPSALVAFLALLALAPLRPGRPLLAVLALQRSARVGPLHRGPWRRSAARQQIDSALAAHDAVGDLVCVALVDVAGLADSTLELHARTLLHDVRGLVRRSSQIGRAGKCDMVPGGVRFGPDLGARTRGCAVGVRLDLAHVVRAERALDWVEVRQRRSAAGHAALRGRMDMVVGSFAGCLALHRGGVRIRRLGERALPRRAERFGYARLVPGSRLLRR